MPVITQPSRQCGKAAARGQAFDRALRKLAPDLTRPERTFIASLAGMIPGDLYANATFADLEIAPYGRGSLVVYVDTTWRRHVGLRHQHSDRFRLTDAGRALVLRAACEIEVTR